MHSLHEQLCKKFSSYNNWHQNPIHKGTHWFLFLATVIFTGVVLVNTINILPSDVPEAQAATNVLKLSDLSCAGVFVTSPLTTKGGSGRPITYRYEADGKRHYLMHTMDDNDNVGHVVEFPEPATLSPCNTPLLSASRAGWESWGGDWGEFRVAASDNFIPGNGVAAAYGMHYDSTLNQLVLNWSNTYASSGNKNSFAAATLNNTTHKLNTVGCWAVDGTTQTMTATGVLFIPNSFVSQYLPSGARWGVGFGGSTGSVTSGLSYGPTLFAMPPPPANPCTTNTDYRVPKGTVLSLYYPTNPDGTASHNLGSFCDDGLVVSGGSNAGAPIGVCNLLPPTPPYPAKMAFNKYSRNMYTEDWDPYQGGNGWFGFGTGFTMGWYDDGAKAGIVVPIATTEGWANTKILSNPAPTLDTTHGDTPTGVMYLESTSTHDGLNMNPGDYIWIETCKAGVTSNCERINGRNESFAKIDSVNPATGRVAFTIGNGDFGSGDHKPVVGGGVYFGCLYAHGAPSCSRFTNLLQIYDPAQYGEVARGTRQPYNVTYNEEMNFNPIISAFGCPECGGGIDGLGAHWPQSVMTDPSAHQIMIAYSGGGSIGSSYSGAVYVFNVGSGPTSSNPTATLSTSQNNITAGSSATLLWNTTNASSISISPSIGSVSSSSGSRTVTPSATTTYTLTAVGNGITVTSQVTINVGSAVNPGTPAASPSSTTLTLNYLGKTKDLLGTQRVLSIDGQLDAVFSVTSSAAKTITSLNLKGPIGEYDTSNTSNWVLGAASSSNGPLLNSGGGVNFPVSAGGSFNVFASDNLGQAMYLKNGDSFTITAKFSDGSYASDKVTLGNVTSPSLVGDLDNNNIVNSLDWSLMNAKWFTSDTTCDLNHDGIVNSLDFSILNRNWLKTK